ncbi:MAG: DivIVA domain-containing protein [Actinomycetota bacterium]
MPLTPIDIQQKTFGPELRGYNMDEVDDFLDEVVATLKDYDQRIRDAQDRIRALEAEVTTRGEDETAISRALVAAQKQADAVLEEARQEAERIRSDAFDEADRLRADRDAERMTLTQEIARMRATVADLKRRVVDLATSAGEDLDAMDAAIAAASEEVSGPDIAGEHEQVVEGDVADGGDPWYEPDEEGGAGRSDWEVPAGPDIYRPGEDESGPEELPGEHAYGDDYVPFDEDRDTDEGHHAEGEDTEELGDLADELAGEAEGAPSDDTQEPAPPPSRRPWERGSV